MHVGIADHLGWAVVVTASPDHVVVDRRRIELLEPGYAPAPVEHDLTGLDDVAAAAFLAGVRAAVARATRAALDEVATVLPAPVLSVSVRHWPPDFPESIEVLRRAPYNSRADGVMYRQVLDEHAHARGWPVHLYDPKHVEAQAAALLGPRAHDVLHGPRSRLGPPWTKDHRVALAAAIVAGSA